MSDIELRVTNAWASYHKKSANNDIKPNFICLTVQDHYALSKALNSNELIKKWNSIPVLVNLEEYSDIFFLRK